jgi:oxaloacetate decarboxylase alpha subunit
MDSDVKHRILDRPRARQLAGLGRPQQSLQEIRAELGGPGVSDEELLLRFMLNKNDIAAMRAAGPVKEYDTVRHPLVRLMAELTKQNGCNLVQVSKPGFALSLEKNAAASGPT